MWWIFGGKFSVDFPKKKGLQFVTDNFTTFFTSRKELYHLELTLEDSSRRRANVQQLTCNIVLPCTFYSLFFSCVLLELKPFVLQGKVLGENCEKV